MNNNIDYIDLFFKNTIFKTAIYSEPIEFLKIALLNDRVDYNNYLKIILIDKNYIENFNERISENNINDLVKLPNLSRCLLLDKFSELIDTIINIICNSKNYINLDLLINLNYENELLSKIKSDDDKYELLKYLIINYKEVYINLINNNNLRNCLVSNFYEILKLIQEEILLMQIILNKIDNISNFKQNIIDRPVEFLILFLNNEEDMLQLFFNNNEEFFSAIKYDNQYEFLKYLISKQHIRKMCSSVIKNNNFRNCLLNNFYDILN
jgi:hypothetical protein